MDRPRHGGHRPLVKAICADPVVPGAHGTILAAIRFTEGLVPEATAMARLTLRVPTPAPEAAADTLEPAARQRGPLGIGTPSCRQIPRAVAVLIARWRGTTVRSPVAAFSHSSCWLPAARARSRERSGAARAHTLLHAAISTGSTSAQPVCGIVSPRTRRSLSTSAIASLTIARAASRLSPCVWTAGSQGRAHRPSPRQRPRTPR